MWEGSMCLSQECQAGEECLEILQNMPGFCHAKINDFFF